MTLTFEMRVVLTSNCKPALKVLWIFYPLLPVKLPLAQLWSLHSLKVPCIRSVVKYPFVWKPPKSELSNWKDEELTVPPSKLNVAGANVQKSFAG